MFWNYIKIGFRNLIRQKMYAIINVIGLAMGLAAVLIIALYIQYETGYNKHIPDADRVYRCVEIQHPSGIPEQHVAVTMGPLAEALETEFPEVEESLRMLYWGSRPMIYKGQQYNEDYTVFADSTILDMFGIRLIYGDPGTAMREPGSIIFNETEAKKIFGSAEAAMGKEIQLGAQGEPHIVTGIMEDQPEQAHFQIHIIVPLAPMIERLTWLKSWGNNTLDTYVRLKPNTDLKALEAKFPLIMEKYTPTEDHDWSWSLYLQPIRDIHLNSGHVKFQIQNYRQGSRSMVYIFGITGLLIIVMACINFINMAIARSVKRAREVGMRKVLGANRSDLIYQFLGESFILTVISVIIALLMLELLIPSFSRILEIPFSIDITGNWIFNIGLVGLILGVSLVSGSYPAFYLSQFQPIKVLKGRTTSSGGTSGLLTKALVVFQFAITIGLLFCIGIINRQYNFLINTDLGLNYDNVISVPLFNNNNPEDVAKIRNSLLMNTDVVDMAFVSGANGVGGDQSSLHIDDSLRTPITCRMGWVDYDYFPMMEIPIVEGRNFSRDYALDEKESIIINEAAAKALGWDNPIGKTFMPIGDTINKRRVIGVVKDYHYYSLHSKIEPAVYLIKSDRVYVAVVKARPGKMQAVITALENTWAELFPGVPFEYQIAEKEVMKDYTNEANMLKIFTYLTILSIVISLLGLYGLTSLQTEKRTREIGIRKAFGGSPEQIMFLVVKDFLILLLVAAVVVIPLSWYFMQQTLSGFAYHITIGVDMALYATGAVLIIGILTVIYHVLRAANTNPVDALRYE